MSIYLYINVQTHTFIVGVYILWNCFVTMSIVKRAMQIKLNQSKYLFPISFDFIFNSENDCQCLFLPIRSRKLIQESEQHLTDMTKILQNDKRYLVLDCMPDERHKLIMAYVEELERRGPPPPPTAFEPARRSTKWSSNSIAHTHVPFSLIVCRVPSIA